MIATVKVTSPLTQPDDYVLFSPESALGLDADSPCGGEAADETISGVEEGGLGLLGSGMKSGLNIRCVAVAVLGIGAAFLPSAGVGQEASLNPPENSSQISTPETSASPRSQEVSIDLEPVTLEEIPTTELTSAEPNSAETETKDSGKDSAVVQASAETVSECDADACDASVTKPSVKFGDWVGYNPSKSDTTWLADDEFGMFSLESFPTLDYGKKGELVFGTGFHFLNGPAGTGPSSPDMPPRLFDLQMAYHSRNTYVTDTVLDVKLGVGIFTDFEGSARKGVRFPGHIVGHNQLTPTVSTVLGLEILDRDDISVLPVAGVLWKPHPELLFELVFPRPSIQMKLDSDTAMYFAGELGGGTWAIQRDNTLNDNVTYRDLRVLWGIQDFDDDDTTWEIGWAFDRSLEYRSGQGDTDFGGAFLMRWHKRF